LDGVRIKLTQYSSRRNLQLITAADFKILRKRGCPKEATIQKICRSAREETQGRETLDDFWDKPGDATGTLGRENEDLYRFEERLKG